MTSSVRLHQLLLGASLVIPALLFTAAAWQNREDVLREGNDTVQRTAAIMQEHGRKVFETAELAIGQVDERIDDQDWATISASPTSAFLRRLKSPMDQLVSIWVTDRTGTIRAGSQAWPVGANISDRTFFKVQQEADQGTYVGAPYNGISSSIPSFAIIRRRTSPEGGFDGTIHAAVSPTYFAGFYADAAPRMSHTALLVRDDGAVLARDPPMPPGTGAADVAGPLVRRVADSAPQGAVMQSDDGDDYAIRKVGHYPAYVVFSVPHQVLLERWYRNLRNYGAVAAAAAVTLLAVSWLALGRAQAEQAALSRLRCEIRQRQAAELQLRHAQRMEAVGQLTGGVAHDFNNLLTAILGNLELIQRSVAHPEGRARIERLAGTAIKAVQRGASLTKSLLAFSRKQPLQPQSIDANAQLEETLQLLRQAAGASIAVTFEPDPFVTACMADPAELEAAMLNLAINARDAMPDGGSLRISTRMVELGDDVLVGNDEAAPGRFLAIAVADTGYGMSGEVAAKAFEPFFTTKPIGQGTGLGLSQVFGFARQLRGHVVIDSRLGGGTVVTLFLPAHNGDASPTEPLRSML